MLYSRDSGASAATIGAAWCYAGTVEHNEISIHEARIATVLMNEPNRWFSSSELADLADVAGRTARLHVKRYVDLGLVDIAEVFPAHRYRWSQMAGKRNAAYHTRLANACDVFGMAQP